MIHYVALCRFSRGRIQTPPTSCASRSSGQRATAMANSVLPQSLLRSAEPRKILIFGFCNSSMTCRLQSDKVWRAVQAIPSAWRSTTTRRASSSPTPAMTASKSSARAGSSSALSGTNPAAIPFCTQLRWCWALVLLVAEPNGNCRQGGRTIANELGSPYFRQPYDVAFSGDLIFVTDGTVASMCNCVGCCCSCCLFLHHH